MKNTMSPKKPVRPVGPEPRLGVPAMKKGGKVRKAKGRRSKSR